MEAAPVAPVVEVEDPAKAKAKRSFMCRVFKKCDPPVRKNRNQRQSESATPPEATNTP